MLTETDRAHRGELAARLRSIGKLRPPVDDDVFYLSKLGVVAERRGEGLGRALAVEYMAAGSRAGFYRFQLDVETENRAAVSLYESIGMSRVSESISEDRLICLQRMARDCGRGT
jgi:ribosomal protein S18 acetylase RimI-like enzyme